MTTVYDLPTDERDMMNHVMRWGSDGYGAYITKSHGGWAVVRCPKVFRTKREAVAQFEGQLAAIRDKLAAPYSHGAA